MRQLWFLFSIGIFAVGLGGCGSTPEETASTPSPTTSPAASPEAAGSPQPNATPSPGKIAPFKDPLVREQSNVAAGAGLIQSTNPEERLNLLGKRPTGTPVAPATTTAPNVAVADPFSVLPPLIVQTTPDSGETPEPPEQTTREVPKLPKLTASVPVAWRRVTPTITRPQLPTTEKDKLKVPTAPATPISTLTQWRGITLPPVELPVTGVPSLPKLPLSEQPVAWRDPNARPPAPPPVAGQPFGPPPVAGQPLNAPPVPAKPLVPPPPPTDLAQGVEVTGILQVGNQTKIILKAPNEPTSRYVSVGQRVSNGQVLVKRVKFDTGGEPIVIFEQNGVEIAKSVGATNPPADQQIKNISMRSSRPTS